MDILDIQSLRIFLEAARTLNFTEAGRLLGLSQPAVSMQIRSLEEHLQVQLFERNPRGLLLTRAGQALVPRAEQIINLVVSTEQNIRVPEGELAGDLAIGCSSTAGQYLLPHVVAQFRRRYPRVNVTIPVVGRSVLMERVASGEYDMGMTSLRVAGFDVDYHSFVTDHLALIAPASHPWARRESIRAEELCGEPFICRVPDSACRQIVTAGLEQVGLSVSDLDIVMEVGSAEALAMAVEHGIGLAFLSMLAAVPRISLGRLATVQVEGLDLRNPVEIVTPRNRAPSPVVTRFVEFVNQPPIRARMQALAEGRAA
jgi:DNA-binding transcriptional LysR family regulator